MKKLFKYVKIAIFLLALVLIVNILKKDFNSNEFKELIVKANYFYLLQVCFFMVLGIVLKGHRLKVIAEQFDIKVSILEAIKIQLISITFASITPGRAGEFTKIFLLAKENKKDIPLGTAICVFERLIDVIVLVLSGIILCILTLNDPKITYLLTAGGIGVVSSLFLMFKLDLILNKFGKYIPEKIKEYITEFELHKTKLQKKTFFVVIYSVFIWYIDALFQSSILKSVGSFNPILTIFGINGIVAIMGILTILPMGLGTVDVSALYLYNKILQIPRENVVFLLVSYRFFGIGILLLMLLPVMIMQKGFVEGLYNKTIKKREE